MHFITICSSSILASSSRVDCKLFSKGKYNLLIWKIFILESIYFQAGFITDGVESELTIPVPEMLMKPNEYINCDANLPCYSILTEKEVINEIRQDITFDEIHSDSVDGAFNADMDQTTPNFKGVIQSLPLIWSFFENDGLIADKIDKIKEGFFEMEMRNMSQTKITDFFKCSYWWTLIVVYQKLPKPKSIEEYFMLMNLFPFDSF